MKVFRKLLLVSAFVPWLAPPGAEAQALYAENPGVYLTASLDQPYLLSDVGGLYLGGGVRFTPNTDLGFRVNRGADVPPGNPLPIIYIGETSFEAALNHIMPREEGGGVRVLLGSQVRVQDRSHPVQQLPDPVTFRGGARLTERNARLEVARYWRLGDPGEMQIHPLVGALGEVRSLRDALLDHSPHGPTGVMHGETRLIFGIVAGAPVSIGLNGSPVVVVEPLVRIVPIPSVYGVPFSGGISVHLNF